MSQEEVQERSDSTSFVERHAAAQARVDSEWDEFLQADKVSTLEELFEKLDYNEIHGFEVLRRRQKDRIDFLLFEEENNQNEEGTTGNEENILNDPQPSTSKDVMKEPQPNVLKNPPT